MTDAGERGAQVSEKTKPQTFEQWRETALWYGVMEPDPSEDYTSEGQTIYRLCNAAASEAWEASRRQALEEAAAICDRLAAAAHEASQSTSEELAHKMLRQVAVLGREQCASAIRREAEGK